MNIFKASSVLFAGIFSIASYAQAPSNMYHVIADNGLVVRNAPDGKRIGKIPYGYQVKALENAGNMQLTENHQVIQGNWQRIDFISTYVDIADDLDEAIDSDSVYISDIYLQDRASFIAEKQRIFDQYINDKHLKLATEQKVFALKGDFFGDGVADDVLALENDQQQVLLVLINHKPDGTSSLSQLGGEHDPFDIDSYSFGILHKVVKGVPLWSNYEDDYRNFSDVPANEIVVLDYDALYMHEYDAGGGGFVFWQNNRWHWLQQE